MIGSSRAVQVHARRVPTDLRLGFDGLYGIVRRELGADPRAGGLFLFVNKRRTSAKVLHWDGTGLCLYAKRLARGCFSVPWLAAKPEAFRLTTAELALFLEGARMEGTRPVSPTEVDFHA